MHSFFVWVNVDSGSPNVLIHSRQFHAAEGWCCRDLTWPQIRYNPFRNAISHNSNKTGKRNKNKKYPSVRPATTTPPHHQGHSQTLHCYCPDSSIDSICAWPGLDLLGSCQDGTGWSTWSLPGSPRGRVDIGLWKLLPSAFEVAWSGKMKKSWVAE